MIIDKWEVVPVYYIVIVELEGGVRGLSQPTYEIHIIEFRVENGSNHGLQLYVRPSFCLSSGPSAVNIVL